MALIPIADLEEATKQILTAFRAGVQGFACESKTPTRIQEATFSFDVIFPGDEVIESRETNTQDGGTTRTTTTERPFTEFTETVKSGGYTQSGNNTATQGGGSEEATDYEYDSE